MVAGLVAFVTRQISKYRLPNRVYLINCPLHFDCEICKLVDAEDNTTCIRLPYNSISHLKKHQLFISSNLIPSLVTQTQSTHNMHPPVNLSPMRYTSTARKDPSPLPLQVLRDKKEEGGVTVTPRQDKQQCTSIPSKHPAFLYFFSATQSPHIVSPQARQGSGGDKSLLYVLYSYS